MPIAASQYENTVGIPVLFAHEVFAELNDLRRDEGAKKIIVKNSDRTALIELPEAATDIDTPQDFEKLTRRA